MSHAPFVLMYDFLENIGKGHFATVKRAQHVLSKEQVAVKIIGMLFFVSYSSIVDRTHLTRKGFSRALQISK
jgi:serine/threonine protein kinase